MFYRSLPTLASPESLLLWLNFNARMDKSPLAYHNMTALVFGANLWWLPLTAGCVKLQLPASSSRVRHNGERVPAAVLAPVSIWFVVETLKLVTYSSPKQFNLCMWWLVILYNLFWERQITLSALAGHTVFRAWRRSSRSWTLHDGMCKATTPFI